MARYDLLIASPLVIDFILASRAPRFARPRGDAIDEGSIRTMGRIERQAREHSGLGEKDVVAAWDFMVLPVPVRRGVSKKGEQEV